MQSEAPLTMDPADHTASLTADVLSPMYEGLTQFDSHLNIVPWLATSWKVDASGKQWTFMLRRDVYFHDGIPFNAEAVVHSFRRLMDPARGLAGRSRIQGIIGSVQAQGDHTVVFTLMNPYAPFLRVLAVTPIVSPAADNNDILSRYAVGTGPYRFVEWRTGEYVLEQRNDAYWGKRPVVKQLKWMWTTEPVLMEMSVLARQADIVNPLPPIFAEALSHNRKVQLIEGKSTAVFWVALNLQMKPLDDKRVRQALNYGVDREGLVQTQLRGFGTPANSPLAPSDFGYNPTNRGYAYDPAYAKQLLTQAGYPNGFSLKIVVQEADEPLAEALQGMWARIGVRLEIGRMEHGVFSQTIFASPEAKRAQGIGGVLASWAANNADPDYQLSPLYRTSAWSPAGANVGFYSNPRLDSLLREAAGELDLEKRKALYYQAQRIITEDAPHVLLFATRDVAAEHVGTVPEAVHLLPGSQIVLDGQ